MIKCTYLHSRIGVIHFRHVQQYVVQIRVVQRVGYLGQMNENICCNNVKDRKYTIGVLYLGSQLVEKFMVRLRRLLVVVGQLMLVEHGYLYLKRVVFVAGHAVNGRP